MMNAHCPSPLVMIGQSFEGSSGDRSTIIILAYKEIKNNQHQHSKDGWIQYLEFVNYLTKNTTRDGGSTAL